ncbi:exportin 1/5 [Anaeramoeba flamelloides]|uniref:Exportin 1/5 n=1 Tax=Anaeramoeba flamelloides TaxID=1746091 RepID=A0ABQ8YIC8_9EUKA|nr:exportin 1/5 [Anaeramoeba flamelloides]
MTNLETLIKVVEILNTPNSNKDSRIEVLEYLKIFKENKDVETAFCLAGNKQVIEQLRLLGFNTLKYLISNFWEEEELQKNLQEGVQELFSIYSLDETQEEEEKIYNDRSLYQIKKMYQVKCASLLVEVVKSGSCESLCETDKILIKNEQDPSNNMILLVFHFLRLLYDEVYSVTHFQTLLTQQQRVLEKSLDSVSEICLDFCLEILGQAYVKLTNNSNNNNNNNNDTNINKYQNLLIESFSTLGSMIEWVPINLVFNKELLQACFTCIRITPYISLKVLSALISFAYRKINQKVRKSVDLNSICLIFESTLEFSKEIFTEENMIKYYELHKKVTQFMCLLGQNYEKIFYPNNNKKSNKDNFNSVNKEVLKIYFEFFTFIFSLKDHPSLLISSFIIPYLSNTLMNGYTLFQKNKIEFPSEELLEFCYLLLQPKPFEERNEFDQQDFFEEFEYSSFQKSIKQPILSLIEMISYRHLKDSLQLIIEFLNNELTNLNSISFEENRNNNFQQNPLFIKFNLIQIITVTIFKGFLKLIGQLKKKDQIKQIELLNPLINVLIKFEGVEPLIYSEIVKIISCIISKVELQIDTLIEILKFLLNLSQFRKPTDPKKLTE